MTFIISQAEQPLRGMELQEKEVQKDKAYRKSVWKEPIVERCLFILDLQSVISLVKGKYSVGRKFQGLAVRGKKLLTDILVTSRDGDKKIMESIRMASRPPQTIRKWRQLSQFR